MSFEMIKTGLPECAKDIKLNFSSILTEEGSQDLTQKQIYLVALASVFASREKKLINLFLQEISLHLETKEIEAVKGAVLIMAMNNIYYRFTHLVSDKSFASMPAKLRMGLIGNPGLGKTDFELCCLASSAINGCGMCIDAHAHTLVQAGVSKLAIQSSIRIASVVNAVSSAYSITD